MLQDKHNRELNYLRLAVTDRCNLRCFYCMPEEGIPFLKKQAILSYEELLRLATLLTDNGVNKIRITGGEPFVRADLSYFLTELCNLKKAPEISITTNATLIQPYIDHLKSIGIKSINVSLDSLEENRFFEITRRNTFQIVYQNLLHLINEGFEVKVNCVVMQDKNIDDILPLAELTAEYGISVRFLEEMPFNAQTGKMESLYWNHLKILDYLLMHFPNMEKIKDGSNSTSQGYKICGYKGSIGIIPSFSRNFCGTCNRIRISANGDFRTCLYGAPALNLKTLLRSGMNDVTLLNEIKSAIHKKPINGFVAEKENSQDIKESMANIGG